MSISLTKQNTIKMINIIIFFALVIVLCPIAKGAESAQDNKKTRVENSESNTGTVNADKADKAETDADKSAKNTLYDYEKPTVEEESYVWMIIKTIIVLGALVGGFYYFYRFVTKKTGLQSVGREVARVLSVVPVGSNKFLQVIDIAGRILVIGVSDANINLITEIREKDDIDRIRLLSSKSSPVTPGGFQEYIAKYLQRLFKKGPSSTAMHYEVKIPEAEAQHGNIDRMDYLKKQKERLKKINGNYEEE